MDEHARLAHLLRRTTFGPFPGQIDVLGSLGYDAVVDGVLGRGDLDLFGEPQLDVPDPDDDDRTELAIWWIAQMRRPDGGLHEKMVWFWHNHFTSSGDKCSASSLTEQHRRVRRHALGNFRTFAREMVTDAAMMLYLDASGSQGHDPNENLARELMELFTLGRGNYTEDDVKAAAKALSGHWVDWQTSEVNFEPDSAYQGVVEILGRRGRFTPESLVDLLCDQDACAPFVAGEIHEYLVGSQPDDDRRAALATVFRDNDLDILPLIEAIITDPSFDASVRTRPRMGIEWYVAMAEILDAPPPDEETVWLLETIDQQPFYPPNVAGWPIDERWVSPSQLLARSNLILDLMAGGDDDDTISFGFDESDPVPDALARCSVHDISETTRAALDEAFWAPFAASEVDHLLVYLVLTSPEFALA